MIVDNYKSKKKSKQTITTVSGAEKVIDSREDSKKMQSCREYHTELLDTLKESNKAVYELITREYERRRDTLQLVAAENQCSRAVLGALGSIIQNKTAEGYSGIRLHSGCEVIDETEDLAVARAKKAFGAKYANVQPHSGTSANLIVITALLEKADTILSLATEQGGHFSHGAKKSVTAKFFNIENYRLDKESFLLDYDAIEKKALEVKPKLIICGASVYPRTIDFKKFRDIANSAGAYLLADISHISALVTAGAHPSPVDYAHFTTTSTYKAGGPRGGLILMGKQADSGITVEGKKVLLRELIEKATFPGLQGTPYFNNIAAKAVFFQEMLSDEYKARQFKVIENAKSLAENLMDFGYDVLTGGTDNHMIVVNAANSREGLSGMTASKSLEDCGIVVDAVELPYEREGTNVAGGIRLGTPIVTRNGMGAGEMGRITSLMDVILKGVKTISEREYELNKRFQEHMRKKVKELCNRFPAR